MSDAPDLGLIGRQQKRIIAEIAEMRDDMRLALAMLQRLDGTVAGLVTEVRAMHARHDRLARKVADMETGEQ